MLFLGTGLEYKDDDVTFEVSRIDERLGFYIAGFADGEGSFHVVFRRREDYRQPWKVSLCFNISQREERILRLFQSTLECGTMRQRADGVWYFEVNELRQIEEIVIPFFDRFYFLSEKKKRDFVKFKELAEANVLWGAPEAHRYSGDPTHSSNHERRWKT